MISPLLPRTFCLPSVFLAPTNSFRSPPKLLHPLQSNLYSPSRTLNDDAAHLRAFYCPTMPIEIMSRKLTAC